MDFFEKTIDLRIEATREAQKRSRLALIVLAIASVIIVLSEFNVCLSWSRGFAVEELPLRTSRR